MIRQIKRFNKLAHLMANKTVDLRKTYDTFYGARLEPTSTYDIRIWSGGDIETWSIEFRDNFEIRIEVSSYSKLIELNLDITPKELKQINDHLEQNMDEYINQLKK